MRSVKEDFEFLQSIGEGSFGVVFKVRRKVDNKIYVIKEINIRGMTKNEREEAIRECHVLASLNHSHIIGYLDSFIDNSSHKLNIVMEFAEKGTLDDFLKQQKGKPLSESTIWKFFLQTLCGLHYIHKQKIIHRDLKSLNLFLDKNDDIKIGDFGVSRVLSHTKSLAHTVVGTPYYLSPELCENKPYGEKSDVWALGCVLYELCTFRRPFEAQNQGALILKIVKGRFDLPDSQYSSELTSILKQCLCRQVNLRPTTDQLMNRDSVIQKSRELGIFIDRFSTPFTSPRIASVPSTKENKERSVLPKEIKKSISTSSVSVSRQDDQVKQVILRPNGMKARPPSVRNNRGSSPVPPVMLPLQPAAPLILKKKPISKVSSKQREIDAVKNLPTTLIQKKSEPDILITSKQSEDTKPIVTLKEDRTIEIESYHEVPVAISIDLGSNQLLVHPNDYEDSNDNEAVTWRVVNEEVNNQESNSGTNNTPIRNESSKLRQLNRLLDKSNELHLEAGKIRGEWVPHIIPKDKFEEIYLFLMELRDEVEEIPEGGWTSEAIEEADIRREERISQFVFGRIAHDNVAVVDDMYRLMFVKDDIDKIQNEINNLTS